MTILNVWRGGCVGGPYGPGTGYDPGDTTKPSQITSY